MSYRAVLFDLDGTLLNTLEDLADSMNCVLDASGFPVHGLDAYRYFVGDGVENLVTRAIPEACRGDAVIVAKCLEAMRREYGRRQLSKTRPYHGIPELLDALVGRDIRTAVLSNKPHESTRAIVVELLPSWRFEAVLGERSQVPRKPHPAGAVEVASLMGIPCEQFLYVGDTGTDMITANAAGMFAVGALWGFREAEELLANGARVLIAKPEDLLTLF